MCNGNNHTYGCRCGWGGDGHSGKRTNGNNNSVFFFKKTMYISYLNPNAKCPVCKTSVFYYQSPNGGRVFFDEIGPPWPKHPCTDNPKYYSHIPERNSKISKLKSSTDWQKMGWIPIIVYRANKGRYSYIIERVDKNYHNRIEMTLPFADGNKLTDDTNIIFFRHIEGDDVTIMLYDIDNESQTEYFGSCKSSKFNDFIKKPKYYY